MTSARTTAQRDPYAVLGIEPGASAQQIKKAYRRAALRYHPDRNPSPQAQERFREATRAYEALSTSSDKGLSSASVDSILRELAQQAFGPDMWGATAGEQSEATWDRVFPEDIRVQATVTLEEIASAAPYAVSVSASQPCRNCRGEGGVECEDETSCTACGGRGRIRRSRSTGLGQAGSLSVCGSCDGRGVTTTTACASCEGTGSISEIRDFRVPIERSIGAGDRVRLRHAGHVSKEGTRGDVVVEFEVVAHARFRRRGADLHQTLPISLREAMCGGAREIPGLTGTLHVDIPAGSAHGDRLTVPGAGLPRGDGFGKGALILHLEPWLPHTLSDEQVTAIERLEGTLPAPPPGRALDA